MSSQQSSSIHQAAAHGNLSEVNALLQADRNLVSSTDPGGDTPLHLAVSGDRKDMIELLLAFRADPNVRNRIGFTPLHYACTREITALLLAANADVNAKNYNDETPLHIVVGRYDDETPPHPLIKTDSSETCLAVAQLLLTHGADIDARNDRGRTPLEEAAVRGHKEFVAFLLAHRRKSNRTIFGSLLNRVFGGLKRKATTVSRHGASFKIDTKQATIPLLAFGNRLCGFWIRCDVDINFTYNDLYKLFRQAKRLGIEVIESDESDILAEKYVREEHRELGGTVYWLSSVK